MMRRSSLEEAMSTNSWTIAEAKAKFGEVVEKAQSQVPQTITRLGRTAVVVVAAEEWDRKTKRIGNLAEFFTSAPLRGSGIELARRKDKAREVDL
jgi:prevent-host-death family protein